MKRPNAKNRKRRLYPFDFFIYTVLVLFILTVIFTFMHVVSISISDPQAIDVGKAGLLPKGFNTSGYAMVIKDSTVFSGYKNSIL